MPKRTLKGTTSEVPYAYGSDARWRASGRTTRIIDAAVQTLFRTGRVFCVNHDVNHASNMHVFNTVVKRLRAEHPHTLKHLRLTESKYLIELLNFLNGSH